MRRPRSLGLLAARRYGSDAARARAAEVRERLDKEYVREFAEHIEVEFPGCPAKTRRAIAEHACRKHSGRVGRSAAAKSFDLTAIELAVQAHVRHVHTGYDELLGGGLNRGEARRAVRGEVDRVTER